MTAIWGPMGWMTLHSVSTLYPETPTDSEKKLLATWLDMFRDTITCHFCKTHFTEMLATYRSKFPMMMNSRLEFMAFAFRAHNTVNRRLNKPLYGSLEECMKLLKTNVATKTAAEYRNAYLVHIRRYWSTMRDMSGIVALRKITEMMKIETDYFKSRDTNFDLEIADIQVLLPYGVLENLEEGILRRRLRQPPSETPKPRPQPAPRAHQTLHNQPVPQPPRFAGFAVTSKGLRLR